MLNNNYSKIFNSLITITLITLFMFACKKENSGRKIDQKLYEMAQETSGFTWYKKTDDLLDKSAGSGHSQPYLKTRYNSIAATLLNEEGMIISGSTFPEDALIVKELLTNETTLGRYAILYKKPNHKFADDAGWVWGYIEANGDVLAKASKKGSGCIECHSQSGNIDRTLMNKFFP